MVKTIGQIFEWGLRLVLGGIFIYASFDKIIHPAQFADLIANYHILPPWAINPAALLLPWLELTCGVCLIIGRFKQGAVALLGLLLIVFIGALSYARSQGVDINCGCFSTTSQSISNVSKDLARDGILLVMVIWLVQRFATAKPMKTS